MRYLIAILLAVGLVAAPHTQPCGNVGHPCPPGPVAMGRLFTAGAESADTTRLLEGAYTVPVGTITNGATNPRSGNRAYSFAGFASMSFTQTVVTGTTYFIRGYFRFDGVPASTTGIVFHSTINNGYSVRYNADGTLSLYGGAGQVGSTSGVVSLNEYHRIELSVQYNTGAGVADNAELRLDGATIATDATDRWSVVPANIIFGSTSAAIGTTTYLDDIAINDNAGAAQNSWPGEGKEVLLLPTADSAVGTGWTLGTGTAISSNGFAAVANIPPIGVADLAVGSDPKQIRNASSNANVNYDATMTTYAAAGIGPNDTVTVIDPIVVTAAPVVTSAKAGTVGVVSNPAIANVALGAAGTAGAFWQGLAAGTYAAGWKASHGTTTYSPAVTIGTAPVMRVTQVTASTRIAMVCFMGMYVEYQQGPLPYVNPMPPLLAQ